ncbi:MAG: hypothetical protein WBA52_20450 [Dolichospermum sp.]
MSNLFTAVSVEQQEIVAGGRRNSRPIVVVEPKITTINNVVFQGNFNASRGGNPRQSNRSDIYNYVG